VTSGNYGTSRRETARSELHEGFRFPDWLVAG